MGTMSLQREMSKDAPFLRSRWQEFAQFLLQLCNFSVNGHSKGVVSCEDKTSLRSNYSIGKKLGEGSFGVVYYCTCRTTDAAFAVKMVDRVEASQEVIDREVTLLIRLDHRNLVKFHAVFYETCFVCIVMDAFLGGDVVAGIEHHWKEHRRNFDAQECVHSCMQMLAAVEYLHNSLIMHRDIKCDNFLASKLPLTDDLCHIALSDFGAAIPLKSEDERRTEDVGSTLYWSPEIFEKSYGLKVDVFALGVLIFGMVTGSFPFTSQAQVMDTKRPPPMARVRSAALSDFLLRAMAKSAAMRASAAALRQHR